MRIEDLDRAREVAGSADGILRTLQGFGFEWDGEIVRQSGRGERYAAALRTLANRDLTFEPFDVRVLAGLGKIVFASHRKLQ